MKKRTIPIFLLVVALVLVGCQLPGGGVVQPTLSQADIDSTLVSARTVAYQTIEAEVAATELARPTNTLLPSPTFTLLPSSTPYPTYTPYPTLTPRPYYTLPPTKTPTSIYSPTPTATATSSAYNCTIVSVSPAPGTKLNPREDFDARWTIKNTGTETWLKTSTDYRYSSGEKMHKHGDIYDLTVDVARGAQVDLLVDMLAPTNPGTYSATWKLVTGSQVICTMTVEIKVK